MPWDYELPTDTTFSIKVTDDIVWQRLRVKRDTLLAESDWRVVSDASWDTAPWIAYRAALRDLPDNTTDPRQAVWPEPPATE